MGGGRKKSKGCRGKEQKWATGEEGKYLTHASSPTQKTENQLGWTENGEEDREGQRAGEAKLECDICTESNPLFCS